MTKRVSESGRGPYLRLSNAYRGEIPDGPIPDGTREA